MHPDSKLKYNCSAYADPSTPQRPSTGRLWLVKRPRLSGFIIMDWSVRACFPDTFCSLRQPCCLQLPGQVTQAAYLEAVWCGGASWSGSLGCKQQKRALAASTKKGTIGLWDPGRAEQPGREGQEALPAGMNQTGLPPTWLFASMGLSPKTSFLFHKQGDTASTVSKFYFSSTKK